MTQQPNILRPACWLAGRPVQVTPVTIGVNPFRSHATWSPCSLTCTKPPVPQVLVQEQDFYDLMWAYLEKAKRDNIVHAEIFFDPQSHTERGVSFETCFQGFYKATQVGARIQVLDPTPLAVLHCRLAFMPGLANGMPGQASIVCPCPPSGAKSGCDRCHMHKSHSTPLTWFHAPT